MLKLQWEMPRRVAERGLDVAGIGTASGFGVLLACTFAYLIAAMILPDRLLPSEYSDLYRWDRMTAVFADPGNTWAPLRTMGLAICIAVVEIALAIAGLILCDIRRPSMLMVALLIAVPLSLGDTLVSLLWYPFIVGDDSYFNLVRHMLGMQSINYASTSVAAMVGMPWLWVSIGFVEVWRWTPFCAGVLLAGISTIPQDETDYAWSARLSRPKTLRFVVWPRIRILLGALFLFQIAYSIQVDNLYVLLAGESQLAPMTGPAILRLAFADRQLYNALVLGWYTAITYAPVGIAFGLAITRFNSDQERRGAA